MKSCVCLRKRQKIFMVEVNEGSKMDPGFEATCTETNWFIHVGAFEKSHEVS